MLQMVLYVTKQYNQKGFKGTVRSIQLTMRSQCDLKEEDKKNTIKHESFETIFPVGDKYETRNITSYIEALTTCSHY